MEIGKHLEYITPEEAKTIVLPLRPIKRIRQIGKISSEMSGLREVGWTPTPFAQLAYTRRGLVKLTETHERSVAMVSQLRAIQNSTELEQQI